MAAFSREAFGLSDRAWLNTAHQGPLPLAAAQAAREAIEQKLDPRLIPEEAFFEVPQRLRATLGRLVGADPREIVLANSTSYGLDLLAHGLPLRAGDEVLVVEGDFPASIYPWLPLRRRGVTLRNLPAASGTLDPDDLRAALTDRTRVVCTSWVFSFTGHAADVPALAEVCRRHGETTSSAPPTWPPSRPGSAPSGSCSTTASTRSNATTRRWSTSSSPACPHGGGWAARRPGASARPSSFSSPTARTPSSGRSPAWTPPASTWPNEPAGSASHRTSTTPRRTSTGHWTP